jgi:ATP-dependent Lon protease
LYIETVGTKNPDKEKSGGGFRVTGQLGEVMKESSTISYINAKRYVEQLQPGNSYFYTHDINLHVPEGATPKVCRQFISL